MFPGAELAELGVCGGSRGQSGCNVSIASGSEYEVDGDYLTTKELLPVLSPYLCQLLCLVT